MNTKKIINYFAYLIALGTLVLVGLGGYVRATHAGLSCPDWPLCFGKVVPEDFGNGVAQEVIHRYVAGGISVLFLMLFVLSFFYRKSFKNFFEFNICILVLLIIQIVFGGLTVTMKLQPIVVTTHLILGTILLQSFIALSTDQRISRLLRSSSEVISKSPAGYIVVATFITLQIIIGGYVGSSGASLACPSTIMCEGSSFLGSGYDSQILQMVHRTFGVLIFLHVLFALVFSKREKKRFYGILFFFVLIQIGLGVLNVYLHIPPHVTVTHLLVAQAILAIAIYYCRLHTGRFLILEN